MKAIRARDGRIHLDESSPAPIAPPGEAVIRPVRASIAAPDLDIVAGGRCFDGILGHLCVGVVEHVEPRPGRDDRAWIGRRVVGAASVVCGKCELCRAGLSLHCAARQVSGLLGRDGCFAERFLLPVANLVEVPRSVGDDAAVFAEPLSRALHAAQILRVEGKPYVTVLGDGVDALLCAQVLARLNASVRLLGWQPEKFGLCERWGIKHRHADDVGRRHDQDIVVDCTSSARGGALALSLARPRAKIVLCSNGPSIPGRPAAESGGPDLSPVVAGELEILGACGGSLGEAVQLLASNRIETAPLVTSRYRLAEGPAALARAREPAQVRVLLEIS